MTNATEIRSWHSVVEGKFWGRTYLDCREGWSLNTQEGDCRVTLERDQAGCKFSSRHSGCPAEKRSTTVCMRKPVRSLSWISRQESIIVWMRRTLLVTADRNACFGGYLWNRNGRIGYSRWGVEESIQSHGQAEVKLNCCEAMEMSLGSVLTERHPRVWGDGGEEVLVISPCDPFVVTVFKSKACVHTF